MARARTQDGSRQRLRSPRALERASPGARSRSAGALNLIEVTAFPDLDGHVAELGPDDVLEFAWAAHERVSSPRGGSALRTVTGTAAGVARELLQTRRRARGTPEVEDFLEALQWRGRVIAEVFLPEARRLAAESDHDCDCTCAGDEGHVRWTVGAPAWRAADAGSLLLRLACGERVRVRLEEASRPALQRGRARAPFDDG